MLLLFGASMKYFKKTNKIKLMLCRSQFMVHGRVKVYTIVQKQSASVAKVGVAHA